MHNFNYARANDVADAATKLKSSDDGKLLAGGMTLLPTLKNRLAQPSDLIDLANISAMKGIAVEGREVIIKGMTTHAAVAASADVRKAIPALAALAELIGDPAVRQRGTIGGSVANSDPAADYPAAVLALDAVLETNERKIAADDYFQGLFETALGDGEILTAVRFKIPDAAHYLKFRHPASRYAVVGCFIARFGAKVRVAITGAGPCAFRVPEMEAALEKNFAPASVANIKVPASDLLGDFHCSAEYRAHLITVYARRCVEAMTS